jgi:hypothetical protein
MQRAAISHFDLSAISAPLRGILPLLRGAGISKRDRLMTRRRLFNIASALSFAMLLAVVCIWAPIRYRFVPEEQRLARESDEIHKVIERETWGSDAYNAAMARERTLQAAMADYRAHRDERIAAEYWRYVQGPRWAVIALALTPAAWFVLAWWRWEHGPGRASRGLRIWRGTRRIGLAAIVFVSLLCAMFVIWVWVRSYSKGDEFGHAKLALEHGASVNRQIYVQTGRGAVMLVAYNATSPSSDYYNSLHAMQQRRPLFTLGYSHREVPAPLLAIPPNIPGHRFFGVTWGGFRISGGGTVQVDRVHVLVPFWMLDVLLLLPLTAWLLARRFRRREVPAGHCQCGYDLTGNTSGVCPECGKEMSHAEGAKIAEVRVGTI